MSEKVERRLVERRHRTPADLEPIYERLNAGDARMTAIENALRENTEMTRRIETNTEGMAGMASLYADMKKGTAFMCRLALAVKFILDITNRYWKAVLILVIAGYGLLSVITHTPWPRWLLTLVAGL